MTVIERAIALIKEFESFAPVSYKDNGGWAIGWGNQFWENSTRVKQGESITKSRADELLSGAVHWYIKMLADRIPDWNQLSDGKKVALTSFAYNSWAGAYFFGLDGYATISKMLREKNWAIAPQVFGLYVKGENGEILPGLVKRRQKEAEIFLEASPVPVAKIIHDTWAKQSTVRAEMLASEFKVEFKKGREVEYLEWKPREAGHVSVRLKDAIAGRQNWLFFDEHIQLEDEPKGIKLSVPFYLQTDNRFEPDRTCNSSANGMVAKFLGAKISGDDEYYQYVIKYGDTTSHFAQGKALEDVGIKSTWHTDLSFQDVEKSLLNGLPVVVGILHRGPRSRPFGGHMIVVVGLTPYDDWICHDPYGSLLDGYTQDPGKGRFVVYSKEEMSDRWTPDGDGTGWGRLFYGNK